MAAPVIVALNNDYIGSVTAYLQGRLRTTDDVTVEAVRDALYTAAGYTAPEPELFGGEQ
jgi:hypothetical protein